MSVFSKRINISRHLRGFSILPQLNTTSGYTNFKLLDTMRLSYTDEMYTRGKFGLEYAAVTVNVLCYKGVVTREFNCIIFFIALRSVFHS